MSNTRNATMKATLNLFAESSNESKPKPIYLPQNDPNHVREAVAATIAMFKGDRN